MVVKSLKAQNIIFLSLFFSDMLNPEKIQQICYNLLRISTSTDNILKISRQLADRKSSQLLHTSLDQFSLDQFTLEHRSIQDILFHAIYTWKCVNVRASSKTLAKTLMELGHYKEAYSIDPTCKLLMLYKGSGITV